jgi:iron complex transport system substrate-binding protein
MPHAPEFRPSTRSGLTPRRVGTLLALGATAALVLSGCATSAPGDATTTSAAGPTVSTLYGDVTLPANPKRIVAIGYPEATALADLGLLPVGRTSFIPALPAYDKAFKSIPVVEDNNGKPDLEKIAALHPDLIVGDDFADKTDKAAYAKLASIAPTAIFEWKPAAGNWKSEVASTAEAIGRTSQLDALKAAYDKRAAQIRTDYADVLKTHTFDLIGADGSSWYLDGPDSSPGRVLADAGVRFGASTGQKEGFVEYSPERYDLLKNTDVVLANGADAAALQPITSNAVFGTTKAATKGLVFPTNNFFTASYRMSDALLDDFQHALDAAKAKG